MNRPTFDNPVYRLDLRVRVRERRLWVLALFFLLVPLALSMLALPVVDTVSSLAHATPYTDAAGMLAGFALFGHGALLVLLSALAAAQRISQERERRTLPALVNSPLSAARIADGKLLGAWTFDLWLATLTLPFLAVATLWGGVSFGRLLLAWALNVAAAFAVSSFALGLSGLFGRSLSAYLATGAALFLWCVVVPIAGAMACGMLDLNGDTAFAVTLWHLPLAPQAWVFSEGFGGSVGALMPCVGLAVWFAIGFAGRALAIRGLRREVF